MKSDIGNEWIMLIILGRNYNDGMWEVQKLKSSNLIISFYRCEINIKEANSFAQSYIKSYTKWEKES
jgi:hypothetical protein